MRSSRATDVAATPRRRPSDPGRIVHFPPFRLDLVAGQLFRGDEPVALRPKTFATLCHLAARPGELVTKDDLLSAVWPDVAVTEDMPRFSVRELRRALGDDPSAPRFIETVHGRGYRFIGVAPDVPAPPAGRDDAIVVGRDAELALLDGWLAAARGGERVIAFLAGDAGIGKTTLVDAFVAGSVAKGGDALVARGECREAVGAGEPYRPLLEALESLAGGVARERVVALLRTHAPSWLAQLPPLLDPDEAAALRLHLAGSTGERMVRELASWAEVVTADTPLCLVVEDLHWGDRATLDALVALAHGRATARLLVVATYRPVDAILSEHPLRRVKHELTRRRLCKELPLSALSRDAVRAYLAARFDAAAVSAELVEFVHDRSDGNPFFMTAVADQLVAAGVLVQDAGGWRLDPAVPVGAVGIPDTLREMVEHQLATLEPATLSALEAGSVAGVEFATQAVVAATGTPAEEVEDRCDLLVRQGRLLRFVGESEWPDGTTGARYAFRHALYQSVLSDRIPPSRARRLHQLIGERLEAGFGAAPGPLAAELGTHFEKSRDRARAVQYLGQAAEVAQKRFADREAIALIERALALLDAMPASDDRTQQELFLRVLLAPSLTVAVGHSSPELEASSARVRALLPDLGDTPSHLFGLLALFTFELMRGRLDAATDIGARALDLGRRVAPVFVAIGHLAEGMTSCYRGAFADARRHFEVSLASEWPDAWPIPFDPPSVALSHLADRVLVYLGQPEQAAARGTETLARADALGHPFTQAAATSTIGRMYLLLREPQRARELSAQCLRLCAEHGFAEIAHRTTIVDGVARALLGDTDGVVDELIPLLEAYPERAGMVAVTSAHLAVAEAAVAAGRLDDALQLVLEAARLVEKTGERMEEAEAHRLRGELLLALGGRQASAEARAWFERGLAVAREQSALWFELRCATSLARLDADHGRRDETARMLGDVLARFTEGHDSRDLLDARSVLRRLT
jgi:tetratricopeptide (TPR) repeat protein